MAENRFYELLPQRLKTAINRRSAHASEDVAFEPENFEFVEGQIGDDTGVSADDLARSPFIEERDADRTNYQLSVAVVSREDPLDENSRINRGAFYTDLIGHLSAEGGITSDHSRLFDSGWYAWTPPIAYDKWTNFQKYFWTGPGVAAVQGEYITKEPAGTRTNLYVSTSATEAEKVQVEIRTDAKGSWGAGTAVGDLREDTTTEDRKVYRWNGTSWVFVQWTAVADLPTSFSSIGKYFYVARTGADFARPLLYEYSSKAGRWIARTPVVSVIEPAVPVEGMFWEDPRTTGIRTIYKYVSGVWTKPTWAQASTMIGVGAGTDGDIKFHSLDVDDVSDGWSANNWWVHYGDLSDEDRSYLEDDQATRPILEHWGSIETYAGSVRTQRHDLPLYKLYAYDGSDIVEITDGNFSGTDFAGSTIVRYLAATGVDDPVLGFPVNLDNNAEFVFDLTLESQSISEVTGYRYYKDTFTGEVRSIWTRATTELSQSQVDGSWELPLNLTNNPDHKVVTTFSRSDILGNFIGVISTAEGETLGDNGYRWTANCPVTGATAIDSDASLLKVMSFQLDPALDFPEAARTMSREHSRLERRFVRKLNQYAGDPTWFDNDGTLAAGKTTTLMVDRILTDLFASRTDDSAFHTSDMGTYTDADFGGTKPIYWPHSAARVGAVQVTVPEKFTDNDSNDRIMTHDGRAISGYGDERDDVIIDLETRFYTECPAVRRTESPTVSSRTEQNGWRLWDWGTDWKPITNVADIDEIVNDYTAEADPGIDGYRVYSRTGYYAAWDAAASAWFVTGTPATGDIFYDGTDYYTYNGYSAEQINLYPRAGTVSDYTRTELNSMLRNEFVRWAVGAGLDWSVNTTYDEADEFTWNYSAAGVESSWQEIYRRVYGTHEPDRRPWEILGFRIEPSWWRTTWTPNSTRADGSPVYHSANGMWADLKTGANIPAGITLKEEWRMSATAPTPVDASGVLLDPIALGIVTLDALPDIRRDDRWVYPSGPLWESFRNTPEYAYAVAIAGYLSKPARFIEQLWNDFYEPIGGGSLSLVGGTVQVDRNTYTRSAIADVSVHGELQDDGTRTTNAGINSWVSEAIRLSGGDPTATFADVIRQTEAALGWRCAGFINKNRTSVRTPTGIAVPFEDIHVLLHSGQPTQNKFHSGVAIAREDSGYRIYGYDTSNPEFTVELALTPSGGGTATKTESIIAVAGQAEFTSEEFSLGGLGEIGSLNITVDGVRLESNQYEVTGARTVTLVAPLTAGQVFKFEMVVPTGAPNTRARVLTVGDRNFWYYPAGSGVTTTVPYGTRYETNTEVIQFLIDLGRWYTSEGWTYDDPEIAGQGGINDWTAVAGRFAAWSAEGPADREIFVDVAGGHRHTLDIEFGSTLGVEEVAHGGYGVLNIAGDPVRPEDVTTFRVDNLFQVRAKNTSLEIYGLRAHLNEIEHAVFFSNTTRFNDTVYDPVTGLRHRRLTIKTYRSVDWNGRMEAPGYFINGDELLPNFDKFAKDISRYYDSVDPIDDPEKRRQAQELYGMRPRGHFDNLDVAERVQFDHHRGLLNYKGTTSATKAFANALRSGSSGLKLGEAWAWKDAEYGSVGEFLFTSFNVFSDEVRDEVQVVKFTSVDAPADTDIEVLPIDRSDPASDTRWIVPPTDYSTNWTFPLETDKTPEAGLYYRMDLTDSEDNRTRYFHWDPAEGLHDPSALSELDIVSAVDPARYNVGPAAGRGPGQEWGPAQVGTLWWDTSGLEWNDYRNSTKATEWGYTKRHAVTTSAYDNAGNWDSTTATAHGISVGEGFNVYMADGSIYRGYATAVDSDTEITYTISASEDPESLLADADAPDLTEILSIGTAEIVVYEWIEATSVPSKWYDAQTDGTIRPKDFSDPNWTALFDHKTGKYRYFFWIASNKTIATGKEMSAFDVEARLRDPGSAGVPWFAPKDSTTLIFKSSSVTADDTYVIDLKVDEREQDRHSEWLLFSEGTTSSRVPAQVRQGLLNGLAGTDTIGNAIPNIEYVAGEMYGTAFGQTVFRSQSLARQAFLDAVNRELKKYKALSGDFATAFPNAASWWSQTDYIDPAYTQVDVTQVFTDATDRDTHFVAPTSGDFARVNSALTDPVALTSTYAIYRHDGSDWIEVGGGNQTAEINSNIFGESDFKDLAGAILDWVELDRESEILFGLLYEMLDQHDECDWFMKTSWIDVGYSISVSQPSVKPPDELDDIISAVTEIKPYHSKIREISADIVTDVDSFNVSVEDDNVMRLGFYADRLACNQDDDWGWDIEPWDSTGWSEHPWDLADLGRDAWKVIEELPSVKGQKIYEVTPEVGLHEVVRVRTKDEFGNYINSPAYTLLRTGFNITVAFAAGTPKNRTYVVEKAMGRVDGPDPMLTAKLEEEYDWMEPFESSYEHASARNQITVTGTGNDRVTTGTLWCGVGTQDDAERVAAAVIDPALLEITTEHSDLYGGWDNTAWDLDIWDDFTEGPSRKFTVAIGANDNTTAAPTENVAFAEAISGTATTEAARGVTGTKGERYRVTIVKVDYGSGYKTLTEDDEWVAVTRQAVSFPDPGDLLVQWNGTNATINTTYRVKSVYVNSRLLTGGGTDYTLSNDDKTITLESHVERGGLRIVHRNYAENGSTIRLFYGEIELQGKLAKVTATSRDFVWDATLGQYGAITTVGGPAWGETATIVYQEDVLDQRNPHDIIAYQALTVVDKLADHTTLTLAGDTTLSSGDYVINDTDDNVYVWGGSSWSLDHAARENYVYHVQRQAQGWSVASSTWTKAYDVGDASPDVPRVTYTSVGMAGGTSWYGTADMSLAAWPEAHEIAHSPYPTDTVGIEAWFAGHSGMVMGPRDDHVGSEELTNVAMSGTTGWTGQNATLSDATPVMTATISTASGYRGMYQSVTGLVPDATYRAEGTLGGTSTTQYLQIQTGDGSSILAENTTGAALDFYAPSDGSIRFAAVSDDGLVAETVTLEAPTLKLYVERGIGTWRDNSPNNADATEATSANMPQWYDGNGNSDHAGAWFHAAFNHKLNGGANSDNLWNSGGYGLWVLTPKTSGTVAVNVKRSGANTGWSLYLQNNGGNAEVSFRQDFNTTEGVWTVDTGAAWGETFILEIEYDSGNVANDPTIRVNGAVVAETEGTTPVGTASDDSGEDLWIGNQSDGAAALDGVIHEMILDTSIPAAADRDSLFYGIAYKWHGTVTVS